MANDRFITDFRERLRGLCFTPEQAKELTSAVTARVRKHTPVPFSVLEEYVPKLMHTFESYAVGLPATVHIKRSSPEGVVYFTYVLEVDGERQMDSVAVEIPPEVGQYGDTPIQMRLRQAMKQVACMCRVAWHEHWKRKLGGGFVG